jgi:peptide deformylase
MDHLKGILFIKYIQDPKNIWRRNALDKYYDEYGDYPPII